MKIKLYLLDRLEIRKLKEKLIHSGLIIKIDFHD